MKWFDESKIKYIILSVIILLELIIISLEVMCTKCDEENNTINEIVESEEIKEGVQEKEAIKKIKVDIKGAVKKPGVYELDMGSRVSDLIKLAGGLKSNASTKYLNLSKKIEDEMVIKIYTDTQIKNMKITYNVVDECKCPTEDISSCAGASIIDKGDNYNSNNASDKVSLNNASKEELMNLSGIGESKADAIIEYRKSNGGFKTLEELMNVSGIGESAYNKIKDYIKL